MAISYTHSSTMNVAWEGTQALHANQGSMALNMSSNSRYGYTVEVEMSESNRSEVRPEVLLKALSSGSLKEVKKIGGSGETAALLAFTGDAYERTNGSSAIPDQIIVNVQPAPVKAKKLDVVTMMVVPK